MGVNVSAPVKLRENHAVKEFDCGYPALNEWLRRYALQNQRADSARTFVVLNENRVVGYYSLAVGAVDHVTASDRIKKGLARHPIPVMIVARLAVDVRWQGMNIGKGLLKDAVWRTVQADGKPMADNTRQYEWIVKIKENLERMDSFR